RRGVGAGGGPQKNDYTRRRRRAPAKPSNAVAVRSSVPGSGTAALVTADGVVTDDVPLRRTSIRSASPVGSLVSAAIVPAGSENMLKPNELPDVAVPFGEVNAGPNRLMSNDSIDPNVKPSK